MSTDPSDRVFVMVARIPAGEEPCMRAAVEEAAVAMNARSPLFVSSFPVGEPDVRSALRALGCWDEALR